MNEQHRLHLLLHLLFYLLHYDSNEKDCEPWTYSVNGGWREVVTDGEEPVINQEMEEDGGVGSVMGGRRWTASSAKKTQQHHHIVNNDARSSMSKQALA